MDFDDEEPSGAGEAEQGEETSTVVLMDDTSSGIFVKHTLPCKLHKPYQSR
jgi:hypothetical protein